MTLLWSLILLPACAGIAAFLIGRDDLRRLLWGASALAEGLLTLRAVLAGPVRGPWIGLDEISLLFLALTVFLFLAVTAYSLGEVLSRPAPLRRQGEGLPYADAPEAVFTGGLLLFLASMIFVVVSRRLALQWVAIEATTLTSAPLIYYHRHRRSLEAAWKYLLVCSVGIALSLIGVFFIAAACPPDVTTLSFDGLIAAAERLDRPRLQMAFLFILVGYGTKMGLAPLHTWLPDAHSEAPSPVSALLSGALLNCAFLGLLRVQQIAVAAGTGRFGGDLLILFGLLSLALAGVFILRQPDYKRLLAYSSVEHMGLIALGVGLGGSGVAAALFHAVNHSLVKGALFLASGNILSTFKSKGVGDVTGLARRLPLSGALWFGGFLALVGSPPFGLFLSEWALLKTALLQERWLVTALYLIFLSLAFVAMSGPFISMTFGEATGPGRREPFWAVLPPSVLLVSALALGLLPPRSLLHLLKGASVALGGTGL